MTVKNIDLNKINVNKNNIKIKIVKKIKKIKKIIQIKKIIALKMKMIQIIIKLLSAQFIIKNLKLIKIICINVKIRIILNVKNVENIL